MASALFSRRKSSGRSAHTLPDRNQTTAIALNTHLSRLFPTSARFRVLLVPRATIDDGCATKSLTSMISIRLPVLIRKSRNMFLWLQEQARDTWVRFAKSNRLYFLVVGVKIGFVSHFLV